MTSEVGVIAAPATEGAGRGRAKRPDAVEPYLAGCAFGPGGGATYPRAEPRDRERLPADTWGTATIPVGVRLEFVGDARAIEIDYVTATDELGFRGEGAGTGFTAYFGTAHIGDVDAVLGEGTAELPLDVPNGRMEGTGGTERFIVYLPEGMKPSVRALRGVGGSVSPAQRQPRWIVYGDSIAEGWVASSPAGAWPAIAGRRLGLDVVNMGYAGAARGEILSAEEIAALDADVITICHGTNCWTRIPHSAGMMYEQVAAFLAVVRQGHPQTPIVAASPVLRPDAESTPNRLGATLADLREAMERAFRDAADAGDGRITLLPGLGMIGEEHLADGIHPDDAGHERIADTICGAVEAAVSAAGIA